MRKLVAIVATLVVLALPISGVIAAPAGSYAGPGEIVLATAEAALVDAQGQPVGTAYLTETSSGVAIDASVSGLPEGQHGIHLHAVGACVAPDFTSAGGHFNPTDAQHGLENPGGPHAGDMPNLYVGPDGTGTFHYVDSRVTLGPGSNSLLDADGSALVIHAMTDDQMTNPAGNSGARVACGVITATSKASSNCIYFAVTGHSLCAGFLRYWETYGGLDAYGYPMTDEFQQQNPDTGKTYTVQYFERERFEWHPGEWPERWDVMLGRVGYWYASSHDLLGSKPFQPVSGCDALATQGLDAAFLDAGAPCTYFAVTGHTMSGAFAAYWNANGGLAIFGYPISEVFSENGMQVQYFERARFEWHPEFAGTKYEVELGRLAALELQGPSSSVVAGGLDNPRKITVGPDGALYVAESGQGSVGDANGQCFPGGEESDETCVGMTGAVARIANGEVTPFVSGLPSVGGPDGTFAVGVTGVSSQTAGSLYVLTGGSNQGDMADAAGDLAGKFGKLYQADLSTGQVTEVANLAQYEYSANPDGQQLDSDPYAVYDAGNGVQIVADAAGNDLLKVENGQVSTLAVFPPQLVRVPDDVELPPDVQLPPDRMIPQEAVPVAIATNPMDPGAYYVAELPGGLGMNARIWRVVPGQEPQVYAQGFSQISDIRFDSTGHLFVLELLADPAAAFGPNPDLSGALIRVNADGSQTQIAVPGLMAPGGMTWGTDGALYITTFAIFPDQGQVIRVEM